MARNPNGHVTWSARLPATGLTGNYVLSFWGKRDAATNGGTAGYNSGIFVGFKCYLDGEGNVTIHISNGGAKVVINSNVIADDIPMFTDNIASV